MKEIYFKYDKNYKINRTTVLQPNILEIRGEGFFASKELIDNLFIYREKLNSLIKNYFKKFIYSNSKYINYYGIE